MRIIGWMDAISPCLRLIEGISEVGITLSVVVRFCCVPNFIYLDISFFERCRRHTVHIWLGVCKWTFFI